MRHEPSNWNENRRESRGLPPIVTIVMCLMQSCCSRPATLLAVLCLLAMPAVHAEQVLCHYTYGGETKVLAALPVSSPYAVKVIDVGSFFHFRVVFQNKPADIAAIKIYT